MMVKTETTTLRENAFSDAMLQHSASVRKNHESGYERLYVLRDGSVKWVEMSDRTSQLIDKNAPRLQALASVTVVGTGDNGCECQYCIEIGTIPNGYDTLEESLEAAVEERKTFYSRKARRYGPFAWPQRISAWTVQPLI
jgi:hypothetical protein